MRTSAECIRLDPHADGAAVSMNCAQGPPSVSGSHVLLAVGRRPNTDDLGLAPEPVAADVYIHLAIDRALVTRKRRL